MTGSRSWQYRNTKIEAAKTKKKTSMPYIAISGYELEL